MECLMNTDTKIFDDMFDVAGALKDVNVETSKDLSALVSKIQEVRDQLADAEQEVKRLTNIKNQLETDQHPCLDGRDGSDQRYLEWC